MLYFKNYSTYYEFLFWDNSIEVDEDVISKLKTIKIGDNNEAVRKLQVELESLGFKLNRYGIDGKFGHETLGQVKSLFHLIKTNLKNLVKGDLEIKNNEISPEQQNIIEQLAKSEYAQKKITKHFNKLMTDIGNTKLVAQDLITKNIEDPETFNSKLIDISKQLGINPNWLLLVMWKESKINPKAINSNSGASGLIQFMKSTASNLGTSIEAIRNMTGVEQLDYVLKYFLPFKGRIKSVEDLYLITFYPAALGRDDDENIGGAKVAKANKVIDLDKDGQITVGEFKDYVKKDIPKDLRAGLDKNIA